MKLSIVVVNWNSTDLMRGLMTSVRETVNVPDLEIIAVDNASADFDESSFKAQYPEVTVLAQRSNLGYAEGNNIGIRAAKGEYILLLNPDIALKEGAVEKTLAYMEKNPNAAAAAAKLVRPDGVTDMSLRSFPYPLGVFFEYTGLAKLFRKSRFFASYRMRYFDYDEEIEVDQPMASYLMLRRSVLDEVGLFDRDFPIFFNDVDLMWRIKKAGRSVRFLPEAEAVHLGGGSTKRAPRKEMIRESHLSLLRFYEKHFSRRAYLFARLCVGITLKLKGIKL
ncbi:MAG: glycosyltransferase family 2 protein [Abditibacteriota bacterium]|nr:glycosyltransferase family 2 protein [Abditibacteriota bacterium]